MKKLFITGFLWGLMIPFVSSQNTTDVEHHYLKRIENNFWWFDYNLSSKGGVQKLFFGNFNAPVEFCYGNRYEGAYGFRLLNDSLKKIHILEVKYISNHREADEETDKYKTIADFYSSISVDSSISDTITYGSLQRLMAKKKYEDMLKLYKIETLPFPISDQFAEKLYEKMVQFIINFRSKGFSGICHDCYSVTFRTVVDYDELWTLRIDSPKGNALKWSDLCRQIVTDAQSNQLDEEKYITILNTFEN